MTDNGHPIEVDLDRILPLLAREIYTSPYAFLRENVQNAVDAIRMQKYRDKKEGVTRDHKIAIRMNGNRLSIADSGIGMSREDLGNYFWSIGKSGKHTEEAKSAGVVGTFGIGGMANFGVCTRLEVVTKKYDEEHAVVSYAEKSQLSAKENCVFYEAASDASEPGTTVTGSLIESITLGQVAEYLEQIVQFIDIPIYAGEKILGGKPFPTVSRDEGASHIVSSGPARARVFIRALHNGQAEIELDKLTWNMKDIDISGYFSTSLGVVTAYQHGFMLATVPVISIFGLGGMINSPVLRPTAGREAVTDESRALIQNLMVAIEKAMALHISQVVGLPERFSSFYKYICHSGSWELAGPASVRVYGVAGRIRMDSMKTASTGKVYYSKDGHDQSIMQAYSEQSKTVILLSSDSHRQKVEKRYLAKYCNATPLEDRVTCLRLIDELSLAEETIKYQLHDRVRRQYLIDGLHIRAGELSHGAMLWAPSVDKSTEKVLFVDFRHPQIQRLIGFRGSLSFDAAFDMFIRDSVLPHLESAFPAYRKRDFDAFLQKLQSTVEYFEIDPSDIERIQQLAAITNMSPEDVATVFGDRRGGTPKPTYVRRSDVATVSGHVNQVVKEAGGRPIEEIRQELEVRLIETEIDAKILDATDVDAQMNMARYYLALTSEAHVLYRRIFIERRPSTDFSWGGHKAGYLFYGHGSAVVYYDIRFEDLIGETEHHERTGKFTVQKSPLILKNQIFLPVPEMFELRLVPTDQTLRFTVSHQILGVDMIDRIAE